MIIFLNLSSICGVFLGRFVYFLMYGCKLLYILHNEWKLGHVFNVCMI